MRDGREYDWTVTRRSCMWEPCWHGGIIHCFAFLGIIGKAEYSAAVWLACCFDGVCFFGRSVCLC